MSLSMALMKMYPKLSRPLDSKTIWKSSFPYFLTSIVQYRLPLSGICIIWVNLRLDKPVPGQFLSNFLEILMLYNTILSNRNLIPSPVLIKVDTTKVERDIESKLLSQRWNLIQGESTKKQLEFDTISYLLVK